MTLRVLAFAEDILGMKLAHDLYDRVVVERGPRWMVIPENAAEKAILRELEAEHGFAPTLEPHRLTAKRPTDPHDAKRVCSSLFPDGTLSPRAARCWLDTPLDDLSRRGAKTGLPDYLADITRVAGG